MVAPTPCSKGTDTDPTTSDLSGRHSKASMNGHEQEQPEEQPEHSGKLMRATMILLRVLRRLLETAVLLAKVLLMAFFCLKAYRIRLHAVNTFGYVIHEFDPWFNYRATQYLAKNGWHSFFHWYDYMSWYPIGRPIGTTIYPGMQITSVVIWKALKSVPTVKWKVPKEVLQYLPKATRAYLPGHGNLSFGPMTLNQVCCMVPAWYGSFATLTLGLLTAEASGSSAAGVVAAGVMAIIPAHMMRSAAGEYDNECVAVTTFCLTFWLWCRSIRTPRSWPFGVLAGLAYIYAVATWGGYIFIINILGIHAAVLVALGKYNDGVYRAYTLFYIIGTAGATRVPVVNWAPLKSLEQMAPLAVFLVYQLIHFCDLYRRHRLKDSSGVSPWRFFVFRVSVFVIVGVIFSSVCYVLLQMNYFGPLSSRIRGLFIKHQRTGNPLVDSVAEHQPSQTAAYENHLHKARYVALVGLIFCWHQSTPAKLFPVLYAAIAYHFSLKMSRLMIICGPIVSMLAGFPIGILADWCIEQVLGLVCTVPPAKQEAVTLRTGGMGSIWRTIWPWVRPALYPKEVQDLIQYKETFGRGFPWLNQLVRVSIAAVLVWKTYEHGETHLTKFIAHCEMRAHAHSSPRIVFQQNGQIISDYLDGYKWLKNNTPADSRVMAWWDYGYQITGVGNRTTIADGNTWNHEHIATLGRTLTNPEKKAHNIMRHLADYVLVWAGGRSDDMAKSPHLARIANSIFPDVCGTEDPKCTKFGRYSDGTPTPMMAASFLYKAVNHNIKPKVYLEASLFKEVHTSKHGLLRVFKVLNVSKESKAWVADPKNRVCDAPGSWYCVGQYPPALHKLISKRKNFAQLEDFNKRGQEKSAYTKMIERNQRDGKAEL